RTLPRQPRDSASEFPVELFEFLPAIRTGCERDRPIRMKVIHVWKRQKCMERCVDGSGDSILTEGRERVVTDHLILVRFTAVNRLELLQAIQVEQCESGIPDGSQIHSASLDREHTSGPPCKRVWKLDLRA